jgi:hypothetical protein
MRVRKIGSNYGSLLITHYLLLIIGNWQLRLTIGLLFHVFTFQPTLKNQQFLIERAGCPASLQAMGD